MEKTHSPAQNIITQSAPISQLSAADSDSLHRCEKVIEASIESFYEVGMSLLMIRDERLYRQTHATFEAYLNDRWGLKLGEAKRLIVSAQVVKEVSPSQTAPIGSQRAIPEAKTQIPNERVARAIASSAPPGARKSVFEEAQKTAPQDAQGNPKITAQHVMDTAEKMKATEPAKVADEVGRAIVNLDVITAFQAREDFRSLDSRICALKKEFEEICRMKGGSLASRHRQQWNAGVASLHEVLRFAMPFAVCPLCGGDGCDNCGKRGWRGEDEWKALPPEMKGGAK